MYILFLKAAYRAAESLTEAVFRLRTNAPLFPSGVDNHSEAVTALIQGAPLTGEPRSFAWMRCTPLLLYPDNRPGNDGGRISADFPPPAVRLC